MNSEKFEILIYSLILLIQGSVVFVESRCTGYSSPIYSSATSGVIRSPRYPNSYRDYESCLWSLEFPFDHRHYLVLFEVDDVQLSYKRIGNNGKKCTGHLSFFGAETDCKTEKPFCNVYYVSDECEKLMQKSYSTCQAFKRRTLIPTEVKFKSDSYYYDRTPQRGFKLKYQFIDCYDALRTTTTTTTKAPTTTTATTTTTPTTTTTIATTTTTPTTTTTTIATTTTTTTTPTTTAMTTITTETTTPTTTTPEPTTTTVKHLDTALPTTTSTADKYTKTSATVKILTSPILITSPKHVVEQSTIKNSTVPVVRLQNENQNIGFNKLVMELGTTAPIMSSNTSQRGKFSSTSPTPGCENNSDCVQKQTEDSVPIVWIIVPIVAGVILIAAVAAILIVRRRRRRKSEDINYLVGLENPNYNALRKKNGEITLPKSA